MLFYNCYVVVVVKLKYLIIVIFIFLLFPNFVFAGRGCCSHHGGVAGCHSSGKQLCNDGTLSPSCTCTPTVTYIYGCTDEEAKNYNSSANKDDGSCEYYIYGCTDSRASNYDEQANMDDGSCKYLTATFDENDINADDVIISDSVDEETDFGDNFLGLLVLGSGGYGLYKLVNKKKNKS